MPSPNEGIPPAESNDLAPKILLVLITKTLGTCVADLTLGATVDPLPVRVHTNVRAS